MKVFTSDHFETYKRCPKAYEYKYIKKIRFALQKDTYKLGRNIHSLIYYKLRGLPLKKIEDSLDENTRKHWENICDNPLLDKKLVCAEWGFDILLKDDFWLNGRVDAIFEDNGQYIIADWKTGQNLPYAPEEKFQAMVYMYAFYKAQNDLGISFKPNQLKFIFVSTDKKNVQKEITCTDELIDEIEKLLAGMTSEIASQEDFAPNTKNCNFCEFQQICSC